MQRRRTIAAAPQRSASQTWGAISQLFLDTLTRSPSISIGEVELAMAAAAPAGVMLVAAGHLERHPVVLVAAPIHLSINTVSGTAAMGLDENLTPVPGGASANTWTVHLPTPEPLGDAVRDAIRGKAHLSSEEPPTSTDFDSEVAAENAGAIDLDALSRRRPDL